MKSDLEILKVESTFLRSTSFINFCPHLEPPLIYLCLRPQHQQRKQPNMSRVTHLVNLARSLPPSPIRAPGSPQLTDALQKVIARTFPQSSGSASTGASSSVTATPAAVGSMTSAPSVVGPSEEKAMEGIIASLERIQSNAALNQVRLPRASLAVTSSPAVSPRSDNITASSRSALLQADTRRCAPRSEGRRTIMVATILPDAGRGVKRGTSRGLNQHAHMQTQCIVWIDHD